MKIELITKSEIAGLIKKRRAETDKRDYGNLLLIAGKPGMAGASILAAKAALRSGAGLIRVAAPKENIPIIQIALPEAICVREENAFDDVKRFDAIGIGPGMGISVRTEKLLERVLTLPEEMPLIIDADGLNTIGKVDALAEAAKKRGERLILTPHSREAGRLLGGEPVAVKDREEKIAELTEKYRGTVLLKGHQTLVMTPGEGVIWKNTVGNPGMATAGAGDVLTGILLALVGQGIPPVDAVKAGVFIHGLAGDKAAKKYGETGMIASDIIESIPEAFMELGECAAIYKWKDR